VTTEQAADVADYAKRLFPVTTQERIDALGVAVLPFENPAFVKQIVLWWGQQKPSAAHPCGGDVLSIPAIIEKLELEARRQGTAKADRLKEVEREKLKREEARRREETAVETSWKAVNDALAGCSEERLTELKNEVLESSADGARKFLERLDPHVSHMLRSLMSARLLRRETQNQKLNQMQTFGSMR
jgi:hypothetical protein